MIDLISWLAPILFIISYFFKGPNLRLIQAVSAILWIIYGYVIHSNPVLITNIFVFIVAFYTFFKKEE